MSLVDLFYSGDVTANVDLFQSEDINGRPFLKWCFNGRPFLKW